MEHKGFYDLQYFKSIYREYLKEYKERIEGKKIVRKFQRLKLYKILNKIDKQCSIYAFVLVLL
jgi:hypothetical protein